MRIQAGNYSDLKIVAAQLMGKHDTVLFANQASLGFTVWVIILGGEAAISCPPQATQPSTFLTDFPGAVETDLALTIDNSIT